MPSPLFTRPSAVAFVLALLVFLVYLPGLGGDFIFDDQQNVVNQPAIKMDTLSWTALRDAALSFQHGVGRPIPMISFALDHLAWGEDPYGYKLTSVAVHVVNALLVLALANTILALLPNAGGRGRLWTAGLISFLWAAHPLQVSTTLYVVQRMESLSLLFVLLALLAYLEGRKRQLAGRRAWPLLLACLPLVGLGLACKETAALFPAFALALELTVLGFQAHEKNTVRKLRMAHIASVAAMLVGALVLLPHYADASLHAIRDFTAYERVLSQARVIPMYLGWIVVPRLDAMTFYYDNFPASTGMLDPVSTLFGALALLALATSAALARRQSPLYSLGVLWFLASHAITSSYLPLELVFEHRNYFAILGVILAIYGLALSLRASWAGIGPAIAVLLALGLGTLGLIRSATWGDPLHLAMQLAQINPGSSRASTHLGDKYAQMSYASHDALFQQMAEREYERGSRLPGSSPMPEQGLLMLAANQGRPSKPEWWDRVIAKLESQAIGPQEMAMITGLLDYRLQGLPIDDIRLAEAYVVLVNRMQLPPTQYFAFGMHALVQLEDKPLAGQLFELAVDHAEGHPALVQAMSDHLTREGHTQAADAMSAYAASVARGNRQPGETATDTPPPGATQ